MKGSSLVILSVLLVLALGSLAFAMTLPNRVQWNANLGECVYFYTPKDALGAHCFVDEEHCENQTKVLYKDVDASTCYYVARKDQPVETTPACAQFTEGDLIVLDYSGSDPDENVGPAGKLIYTFGKPFDETNQWQTKRGDAGTYTVSVQVSDGELTDEQTVCFAILPKNAAPALTIRDITVNEGETVKLKPTCADEDGDPLAISYSGKMTSDSWRTGFRDAGEYKVTVTCKETTPTALFESKTITLTVTDVNNEPQLAIENVEVIEGETVKLRPSCVDPEGETTTIKYTGDMTSDSWKTGYDDAGAYKVTVTCGDESGKKSSRIAVVTVKDKNRAPMITAIVKKG